MNDVRNDLFPLVKWVVFHYVDWLEIILQKQPSFLVCVIWLGFQSVYNYWSGTFAKDSIKSCILVPLGHDFLFFLDWSNKHILYHDLLPLSHTHTHIYMHTHTHTHTSWKEKFPEKALLILIFISCNAFYYFSILFKSTIFCFVHWLLQSTQFISEHPSGMETVVWKTLG